MKDKLQPIPLKMITTETIKQNFKDLDPRVISMLEYVVGDLQQQYKVIPDFFMITLELLSTQLSLYFMAKDKQLESGFDSSKRSAEYMMIQNTHDKISNIMKELGMTSISKKKLDKLSALTSESTIDDLYESLVG